LFIFDLIRDRRRAAILREPPAVRDEKNVENRIVFASACALLLRRQSSII
jgi:hypothetical protein